MKPQILTRVFRSLLAPLVVLALASPVLAVDQTSGVVIEVVTEDGTPLAGAAITLTSPKLQGQQFRETDDKGRARFLLLPPGEYSAEVRSPEYVIVTRTLDLRLGETRVERVAMAKGTVEESMTVVAQQQVDSTNTTTSQVYKRAELENIQLGSGGRSYQDVVLQGAGVGGGANPAIHGSTLGENNYLIDGVNTTDPVTGTFGLNTGFDTIDQVQVQTGGFRAEYGQATGGIINQVTRSGGNEVDGSVDVRYADERLKTSTAHFPENSKLSQENRNIDFTIGGPIVKDKLWYFLGLGQAETSVFRSGATRARNYSGENRLVKFTWQVNPNHRVSFQYTADPAEIEATNGGPLVADEALAFQEQGALFLKGTHWGRINDRWNVTSQLAYYQSELNAFPLNDSGLPSLTNTSTGELSQNYNDAQYSSRYRRQLALTLQRTSAGDHWHEVKFGFDLQATSFDFRREQPGGADLYYGNTRPDVIRRRDTLVSSGGYNNSGLTRSFFVQDTWHVRDRITLDYGLRFDDTSFDNDDGKEVISLNLLEPRLGAAFDLKGDAKDVLRVSFSRYMDPGILAVVSSVNARADATEVELNEEYYGDINGNGVNDGFILYTTFGGPGGSIIDPAGLDAMHVDEFIVGHRHAINNTMNIEAALVTRKTSDIIEDTYDDATGVYIIENIPELTRKYSGLEFTYSWDARRWHVRANWTISKAKGNIEYTQSLGSDYDIIPDHSVNRYGYLSTDRRHRLKVQGWVDMPRKWTISWNAFLSSGAPYDRRDIATPDYGSIYLEPRGSRRLPSANGIDMDVKKGFDLGKKDDIHLQLIGSISNLLGNNAVTAVNTVEDVDDPDNDDFGNPTAYQQPREYEFGIRLTF